MMAGSRVRMWQQALLERAPCLRTTYLHTDVTDGPHDTDIAIVGMPWVGGDAQRQFLLDPSADLLAFDAVHTFAAVRQILTLYMRALRRDALRDTWRWPWARGAPIEVYPRADIGCAVRYQRHTRSLRFGSFQLSGDFQEVYTCHSVDLVAHATGHAVFDALRPEYGTYLDLQVGAIHEAFADLTMLLARLSQLSQCEAIVAASSGDLYAAALVPSVAAPYATARYGQTGALPSAVSPALWHPETQSVAQQAQVLAGVICDILADLYADYRQPHLYDPAESLFRVGKHLTGLLLEALLTAPPSEVTIRDLADRMQACEPIPSWRRMIERRFAERQVWDVEVAAMTRVPEAGDWRGCCATLQPPKPGSGIDETAPAVNAEQNIQSEQGGS